MKPKVKVCGITRPEDAEMALEAGADYVGIIVYPNSPRYANTKQVEELIRYIPAEKRVIVDVETSSDQLEKYLEYDCAAYQIHFSLNTALSTVAVWSGLCGVDRFWAAPKIPPTDGFPQVLMEFADTILVDAFSKSLYGGTGKAKTNWQFYLDCTTYYQHKNWILAGGLGPENLKEAIEFTEARMVDLNSGLEASPGIKDPEKLKKAFEVINSLK